MISQGSLRVAGRQVAQEGPGNGTGLLLLLTDPGDYNLAVQQAVRIHSLQRPNLRVVDATLAAAGWRFVLSGTGVLAALAGDDAWQDGASSLQEIWLPYLSTAQGAEPLDPNTWRIVRDPGPKVVLELLSASGSVGDVLRLIFTKLHTVTEAPNTVTDPTAAPTAALAATPAAGNVDDGTHSYVFTWVTAHGETLPSPATGAVTVADKTVNGRVEVVVPASSDYGVTSAKVYRTVAGDAGTRKLVGTLGTNGGTFTDNVADASLGADVPATNTAGGGNTVLDADADALALLVGSLILQLAANKAVQNTGNTGLPNDVVDRRSQAQEFRNRSKELRDLYNQAVALSTDASLLSPASAIRDLDVGIRPTLWHSTGRR